MSFYIVRYKMANRPDIWLKKSDLYGTKLMNLLRRNEHDTTLASDFRISEFLFPNANDEDKREIEGHLKGDTMLNIVRKMIELKKEIKQQRGHINRYLQELTLSKYENYKRNPSKSLHVTVRNIDTKGNLIGSGGDVIPADVLQMIESGVKQLSDSNKGTYRGGIEELVTQSIESQFYWKNTDLSMHALGSPRDIAGLIIKSLTGERIGMQDYINKLFLPYIASKDVGAFKRDVADIKGMSIDFKYPKANSETLGPYPKISELLTYVGGLLNEPKTSSDNVSKEFLIIFMVNVFYTVERIYRDVLKALKTHVPSETNLHFNVEKSIQALVIFLNNTVKNFFNIDSLYTPYGFARSRSNKKTGNVAESANKEGHIRVIGSMDVVRDSSKFSVGTYPIKLVKNGDNYVVDVNNNNTIEKLVEMFLGKHNGLKDAKTEKPVYLGGLIMKSPVDSLSIKILTAYFKNKLKAKDRYIKVIEEIIHTSGNYVTLGEVRAIKNELYVDLDNVASYSNPELRNTAYKTVLNEIIRKYLKYRDAEMQDLMASARFSAMLKRYNISKPDNAAAMKRILEISDDVKIENIVEEVMDAKENLIVRLGYHQIMAAAYRVLSVRILSLIQLEMGQERIPNQYISLMKSGFDKADQVILKKVSELKTGSVEFIRNKLKASMNIPDLGINDIGITVDGRRNRNRNRKNNVGNTDTGNLMMMGNAEKPEFWNNLTDQLRGYTLYLPYSETLLGGGLFNILEAAKTGKMMGTHFISDYNLTETKYTEELRLQGYIIVADQESELRKPKLWRAIEKKSLSDARKLGVRDLRIYLYNLIFSEVMYKKNVNRMWSDGAKGKTNLVKYCTKLVSNRRGCPILISREKAAGLV